MVPSNFVSRDRSGDAWFRIGRFDVTTTIFVVLLGAVGLVLSALVPGFAETAALSPAAVMQGQVWRLVTWPLAFGGGGMFWVALTLVLLWYFGSDLERQVGRSRMASLFVGIWAALTVVVMLLAFGSTGIALAGMDLPQFIVLLLWIAENPRRPFFFNLSAWVVGAVLVALQVLTFVSAGDYLGLVALVVSFGLVAIQARMMGLLSDLSWIPGRPRSGRPVASPKQRVQQAKAAKVAEQRASDAERLDQLLDKISAQGIHSLTASEKRELDKLRQRRAKR